MNFRSKDVRVAANMSSVFTLALPRFRDFQAEGLDRHQVFAADVDSWLGAFGRTCSEVVIRSCD
jgi:hypothetical protein